MFEFLRLRHSDQRTVAIALAISVALLCVYTTTKKQETFEAKPYKFRIDINTATLGELQTLPGIGPKLAESIVQYRDQHTPIREFEEIMNVRGIGEKRYNTMKPYFVD
jgi:competence protein ComEA